MALEVVLPAALAAALGQAVTDVVGLGADLQMLGVATATIVAGVHHDLPFGDRSVRQFPGHPVGYLVAPAHPHAAVPMDFTPAHPDVATGHRIFVDIGLQPIGD
jgi:hypothetical protein